MPNIIVLMGPQGAGKGTQAQMLAERFNLPIVATGDMLRDVARTQTDLGHQVRELQAAGQLVPDEILAEVVNNRTSQIDCCEGYILDGFPRTLPQARLLERIAQSQGYKILVIKIETPRDLLYKRLTGRRTCTKCGAIYHTEFLPSKQEGVCDLDGQQLFTRSDDNEEAIRQRLALYDEKTRPLLDYYGESGRLAKVDGTGSPEEVFNRISEVVSTSGQQSAVASEQTHNVDLQ
ncbi:MAG TPA: adenylate kinase [Blastocatellia bacterium]|nr:adenylate kinase [Blastocatellia bacterium]